MNVKVIEGELLDGPGFDPDLDREFDAFREEMNQAEAGTGNLHVYRIPTDERGYPTARGQQSLLFSSPVGSMSLADIITRVRREFIRVGETKIIIRIMGTRSGMRGAQFNKIIAIEKPNENLGDAKPAQNDIRELFATVQAAADRQAAQQQAMFERLMIAQQTRAAAPAPAFDPMQMMQGVIGMMAVAQKMFNPASAAPVLPPTDPMEQLVKGITVMKQLNGMMNPGTAEESDSIGGTVRALVPLAKPLLEVFAEAAKGRNAQIARVAARKPARIAPAPIPNASEVAQAAPIPNASEVAPVEPIPNATEVTQGEPMDMNTLKQIVAGLIAEAERGSDPKAVAEELLENIPEEYDDQIFDLVNNSTSFNFKLTMMDARCAQHAQFFESLRAEILDSFADPDTGEAASQDQPS